MFEIAFIVIVIFLMCALLWLCVELYEHQNMVHFNSLTNFDENHYTIYNSDDEDCQELTSIPDDASTQSNKT